MNPSVSQPEFKKLGKPVKGTFCWLIAVTKVQLGPAQQGPVTLEKKQAKGGSQKNKQVACYFFLEKLF